MTTVSTNRATHAPPIHRLRGWAKRQLIEQGATESEAFQIVGRARRPGQLPYAANFARAMVSHYGGDSIAVDLSRFMILGVPYAKQQPSKVMHLLEELLIEEEYSFGGWTPSWWRQIENFMHDASLCLSSPGLMKLE